MPLKTGSHQKGSVSLRPFPYNKTEVDRGSTGWLHQILFTKVPNDLNTNWGCQQTKSGLQPLFGFWGMDILETLYNSESASILVHL
jgi:hypothetical protein